MKKTLAFALAALMSISLLTGCAADAPDSSGKDKTQSTTAQTNNPDNSAQEEPITLRFVSWQTNHDEGNRRVADAYHELHPNVTVEFQYLGDMSSREYLTKTDIMLMGGEEMDIVMTPGWQDYAARAASGSYLDLDPYFEAEGTTFEDCYNSAVRVDGGAYGIAAEMKYNIVLINKDMLDEANLPVPELDWTWQDYRDYANKLTKGTGADKIYGSYFHTWGNVNQNGLVSVKKGSLYFNEDKTLTFDNPAYADFLQLRYDMENVDQCSIPLADVKSLNMNYRDQFFSGKIAMLPIGTNLLSDIGNKKYSPDFVTTFARVPAWESDDPHYTVSSANLFSIARTSKHPQEAYDFLRFWSTEGVKLKGMFIENTKGADKMDSVMAIVNGFTDKLDMDALTKLMNDPEWVDSFEEYTPVFQSEIESIQTEETDKFLLGSQSLEDTIQNLMDRGNAVIKENS